MLSTGGSAIVARKLGEGDPQGARESFALIVAAGVAAGVVIGVLGLAFLEPLCTMLGANGRLMTDCKAYLGTLMLFVPASVLQILFQSFFVTAGRPGLGLGLTIAAGVSNAVLDYLLIVPAGMGITGAAVATAIGWCIPALAGVAYFLFSQNPLRFARPKLDWRTLGESCFNGSSEMVTNISTGVTTFLFNILMLRYLGEDGVAAITIVLYAQFLLTALYLGFSMGVAPVVSFNYGSGNTLQYGFVTPLFFQLKLLPALLYLLSGIGGGISEYVWMAVNQFLAKAVADILDIESFFFLADLGVKDDVQ